MTSSYTIFMISLCLLGFGYYIFTLVKDYKRKKYLAGFETEHYSTYAVVTHISPYYSKNNDETRLIGFLIDTISIEKKNDKYIKYNHICFLNGEDPRYTEGDIINIYTTKTGPEIKMSVGSKVSVDSFFKEASTEIINLLKPYAPNYYQLKDFIPNFCPNCGAGVTNENIDHCEHCGYYLLSKDLEMEDK